MNGRRLMKKEVPGGVKVISILYYIGAVLSVLGGLLFIVGGGIAASFLENQPLLGIFGGAIIVIGIIFIGLAVLGFFVGRGLWKGKSWARILAIIFAVIGLLMVVYSLIQGGSILWNLVSIVINLIIGGYLLFSSAVKEAFSSY